MVAVKITKALVETWLAPREKTSYKGDFGHVLLIGGNASMGGAIQMAAQAAVYGGSGLTTVASDASNKASLHSALPEAMFVDWDDDEALLVALEKCEVLAIGSGMGRDPENWKRLKSLFEQVTPRVVIIDGDALFFYRQSLDRDERLFTASQVILTPHIGEWRTLSEGKIDPNDVIRVKAWVDSHHVILVLKGTPTCVFAPKQADYLENTTGNPGQAIGGMGDTLVGTIAALSAQISDAYYGAAAGVFLHSAAADQVYEKQYVVVPTVLAHQLPFTMKQLIIR
ncbi:MAG: NAD(P)H-hydrate dehydratase [Aerococcus sp.]|nr:NAD(P)H-hydrate dehydratase [Aerococcus sp.]